MLNCSGALPPPSIALERSLSLARSLMQAPDDARFAIASAQMEGCLIVAISSINVGLEFQEFVHGGTSTLPGCIVQGLVVVSSHFSSTVRQKAHVNRRKQHREWLNVMMHGYFGTC